MCLVAEGTPSGQEGTKWPRNPKQSEGQEVTRKVPETEGTEKLEMHQESAGETWGVLCGQESAGSYKQIAWSGGR